MTQPSLSVGAWSPWTSPDMSGHTNPISKVLLGPVQAERMPAHHEEHLGQHHGVLEGDGGAAC
jgi:hypothetical protein